MLCKWLLSLAMGYNSAQSNGKLRASCLEAVNEGCHLLSIMDIILHTKY